MTETLWPELFKNLLAQLSGWGNSHVTSLLSAPLSLSLVPCDQPSLCPLSLSPVLCDPAFSLPPVTPQCPVTSLFCPLSLFPVSCGQPSLCHTVVLMILTCNDLCDHNHLAQSGQESYLCRETSLVVCSVAITA